MQLLLVALLMTVMFTARAQGDLPDGCDLQEDLTVIGELLKDSALTDEAKFGAISDVTREGRLRCGLYTPTASDGERDLGRCEDTDIQWLIDYFDQQALLILVGDSPLLALRDIFWIAGRMGAHCADLVFNQEKVPGKRLVGPVTFRGGVYTTRMESTSESMLSIEVNFLAGDCTRDFGSFIAIGTEDGEEEAFEIGAGCEVLLEFDPFTPSDQTPNWTFTITPLSRP